MKVTRIIATQVAHTFKMTQNLLMRVKGHIES